MQDQKSDRRRTHRYFSRRRAVAVGISGAGLAATLQFPIHAVAQGTPAGLWVQQFDGATIEATGESTAVITLLGGNGFTTILTQLDTVQVDRVWSNLSSKARLRAVASWRRSSFPAARVTSGSLFRSSLRRSISIWRPSRTA